MRNIHVHQFMTLNGIADAPIWTAEYGFSDGQTEVLSEVTGRAKAILLGRNTYEMFEPAWSTRTVDDDPGAPFFNDTMKYVVSSTRTDPSWRNSEFIGPYDADRIRRLKDEVEGDIFVSGSTQLVRAMLADGLVDGLHLFVYPLVRSEGQHLLDGLDVKFEIADTRQFDNGVVYLHYRP